MHARIDSIISLRNKLRCANNFDKQGEIATNLIFEISSKNNTKV